jgi:hypothetical protein
MGRPEGVHGSSPVAGTQSSSIPDASPSDKLYTTPGTPCSFASMTFILADIFISRARMARVC